MEVIMHETLSGLKNLSVLYIDNDPISRESTIELLELYFNNIEVAQNTADGLEKYQEFYQKHTDYPDIVITDLYMPKMSGLEMIESIRRLSKRQIFVVIMAHNETNYLLELMEQEVTHVIVKPFTIERFEKVFTNVYSIIEQRTKFRLLYEHLEEAAKQKGRFLANMSHEIRTPLNAILGFLTLLEEKEYDKEKLKYLKIIRNSSDSLLNIINDILDLSKIKSGKLSIKPVNFNPYEDLITTAKICHAKASEKEIQFQIKYNISMPKLLYGDVLRIKQIFINLLSNAVKFTPKGSKIKCVIWYKEGYLHIKVKDYGIGISLEQQRRIFDPFTQAEFDTEKLYGGTGLGLSISRELAMLLKGTLTLQSTEGKGSVFTLSLPLPLGKEKQKENSQVGPLKGHILIVEDYEANRMFVSIILQNAGLSYDMAENGAEAVEMFKKDKFDLILMDENMPVMDGINAIKKILQIENEKALPHTPIISLTANALPGDKEKFMEAGFDDYLSKPIDPQTLLKTLALHLKTMTNAQSKG